MIGNPFLYLAYEIASGHRIFAAANHGSFWKESILHIHYHKSLRRSSGFWVFSVAQKWEHIDLLNYLLLIYINMLKSQK
jgi:hypothetical protein